MCCSFSSTDLRVTGIRSIWAWKAAWTCGWVPHTTRLIRSTTVEKSNSLVYCLSAVYSKNTLRASAESACSMVPRVITLRGLAATKRSKMGYSNIEALLQGHSCQGWQSAYGQGGPP